MRLFAVVVFAIAALASEHIRAEGINLAREIRAIRGDYRVVVDLNRTLIVNELTKRWGGSLALSIEQLNAASAARLYRLSLAATPDEFRDALSSADKADDYKPKVLGSSTSDLTYTPINPCRVVDTRFGAGGYLGDGAARDWDVSRPGGASAIRAGPAAIAGFPRIQRRSLRISPLLAASSLG